VIIFQLETFEPGVIPMGPDDWRRAKKKMLSLGFDPQKVEAFLQPGAGQ